jgi:hypothetical protein
MSAGRFTVGDFLDAWEGRAPRPSWEEIGDLTVDELRELDRAPSPPAMGARPVDG